MIGARTREELRQERVTFNQAKSHGARWFALRLAMGYAGIVLLLGTALVSGYVLLHPAAYSTATTTIAASTLLVDILGLVVSIFRLVLRDGSAVPLKPVTRTRPE